MVRLHFTLFPVTIRVRKCLSFLNESRAGLHESFGATSLQVSHKTGCSQGGERGKQNSNTKIQSCKPKNPCCLALGVPTSSIGALLSNSSEYPWHLQMYVCMCRNCSWLVLNLSGTWKPSIPLPKSSERHFSEYALQKKRI